MGLATGARLWWDFELGRHSKAAMAAPFRLSKRRGRCQSMAPMASSRRMKSRPSKSTTSGASSPSRARSSVDKPNLSSHVIQP